MFRDRVLHHFHRAGWTVDASADLGGFRPDLVVERRGSRKAVMVRDEPPSPIALTKFAADCRRRGLKGILVAPEDPVVFDLCETAGLEFLPGESIGEVPVVGAAPEPPPLPVEVTAPASRVPAPVAARTRAIPLWRWGVVALIWAAALALVMYDVAKLT